ncbi:hypothetical protein ELQ92_08720 [Labedella populi]|uniref:Uncharacterized protein n=1 Tax=Labedella populi TaxID=2498850 RepID=A0A3S4C1Y0_9MICO|nr:hypothetical protein [Labedella populi]RWZ61116.1 hypothetical protein ELQ92_08720 [Labedella populi]
MNDSAATRWSNHDISSDGRVVEECIRTGDQERRVTWYDRRGAVMRQEGADVRRTGRSSPLE